MCRISVYFLTKTNRVPVYCRIISIRDYTADIELLQELYGSIRLTMNSSRNSIHLHIITGLYKQCFRNLSR